MHQSSRVLDGSNLGFVVGHYKSGSTWLINLLSLHPEIRGLSETHVFRYAHEFPSLNDATGVLFSKAAWSEGGVRKLFRRRVADTLQALHLRSENKLPVNDRPSTLLDLSVIEQRRLKRYLLESDSPGDYCYRFFGFLLNSLRPGRYLIDKTPTNIFQVPRIVGLFPKAKLISIHRDGRDVVVSDKYYLSLEGERRFAFEESAQRWRRAMEAELAYKEEYNIFAFSYEALLAEPTALVTSLLDFLELPTERRVIDDMIRRSSFEFTTRRKRGVQDAKSFYRKGVAGDWTNHFTEDDCAAFAEIAGDLLVEFGYEPTSDWRKWGTPAPATSMT